MGWGGGLGKKGTVVHSQVTRGHSDLASLSSIYLQRWSPASSFSAWLLTCCFSVTDRNWRAKHWWAISSYQMAGWAIRTGWKFPQHFVW